MAEKKTKLLSGKKNKTFKRIKPLKSNSHKISYLQKYKRMKHY